MINKLFPKNTTTENSGAEKKPDKKISQEKILTKKDLARDVFKRMYGKPGTKRKDIIAAFIKDCDLTKAGASTYYADIKKKHDSSKK